MREGRGGVARSPAVTYSLSATSRPTVDIMQVDLKKLSEEGPSESDSGQVTSRVFGRQYNLLFPLFQVVDLIHLICRYCVIEGKVIIY